MSYGVTTGEIWLPAWRHLILAFRSDPIDNSPDMASRRVVKPLYVCVPMTRNYTEDEMQHEVAFARVKLYSRLIRLHKKNSSQIFRWSVCSTCRPIYSTFIKLQSA